MGQGQKFLTQVRPDQFFVLRLDRVGPVIYGLGLNLENFPLKTSNFSIFFPLDKKNIFGLGHKVAGSKGGRPLIYCGSKVSSGPVRSGQGPSLALIISVIQVKNNMVKLIYSLWTQTAQCPLLVTCQKLSTIGKAMKKASFAVPATKLAIQINTC